MSNKYQDIVYEDAIICHFSSNDNDLDSKARSNNSNGINTNYKHDDEKKRRSFALEDVNLDLIRETVNNHNFEDTYFDKDITLQYCNTALDLLSDIRFLNESIADSEYFQELSGKIDNIFLNPSISNENGAFVVSNDTVKDFAIQSIQEVNKLLVSFEVCFQETTVIREHLSKNIAYVIQDSLTLLLQLWFLLMKSLKILKFKVMTQFIKAKCLIINYELNIILKYLDDSLALKDGETDSVPDINVKSRDSVQHILNSFNSFIRALVQDLVMAESQKNQNLFDRCLDIFFAIESMYNQMNFNWLVRDNNNSNNQTSSSAGSLEGPQEELEEPSEENVYSSPSQGLNVQETQPSTSAASSSSSSPENPDNAPAELEAASPKDLYNNDTASDSDSTMVERSLSISNDPTLSQMSLTRELPYLLSAFHNAKRLENQLEFARSGTNHTRNHPTTFSSPLSTSPMTPSPQVFHSPLKDPDQRNAVSNPFYSPLTVPPPIYENQSGAYEHMPPSSTTLEASPSRFSTSPTRSDIHSTTGVTTGVAANTNSNSAGHVGDSGPNTGTFMHSDNLMSGMNKLFMMNGRSSSLSTALNETPLSTLMSTGTGVGISGSGFVAFGGISGPGSGPGSGFMGTKSPVFNNPILNNLYGVRRPNVGSSRK